MVKIRFQTKTAQNPWVTQCKADRSWFSVWSLSCRCRVKFNFLRSISLALSYSCLFLSWSDLLQILRKLTAFSFAVPCSYFKIHTLWGGTYLYSLYRGVPPRDRRRLWLPLQSICDLTPPTQTNAQKDQTTTPGTTSPTLYEQWVGSLTSNVQASNRGR